MEELWEKVIAWLKAGLSVVWNVALQQRVEFLKNKTLHCMSIHA